MHQRMYCVLGVSRCASPCMKKIVCAMSLPAPAQVHKLPTMFFTGSADASKPAAHFTGLMPESVIQDMCQNRSKFLGTDIRKALSI